MKFYFLKYNNYFNRVEKKEDSIDAYIPYLVADVVSGVINFSVGDGVDTTQILNSYNMQSWLGTPDYCVITDDTGSILHRWFVMECTQLRNGQFNVSLHRDVIADNWDAIVNSPCYIEKATIPDSNDLIFNSEGMHFNQIKKSETLLKDESGIAWIVGYIARNYQQEESPVITVQKGYDYAISQNHNAWSFYQYNSVANGLRDKPNEVQITTRVQYTQDRNAITMDLNQFKTQGTTVTVDSSLFSIGYNVQTFEKYKQVRNDFIANEWYQMTDVIEGLKTKFNYASSGSINNLLKYSNKRISFSDGIYLCKINTFVYNANGNITSSDGAIYTDILKSTADNKMTELFGSVPSSNGNIFYSNVNGTGYYIELEYIQEANTLTIDLPDTRNKLVDAPYDMFCIPYNSILIREGPVGPESEAFRQAENIGMFIANSLPTILNTGTNSFLYDIQVLPYCPMTKGILSEPAIGTYLLEEFKDYTYIYDNENNKVGIIMFPNKSSFTTIIENVINVNDYKVENECDMYRLCSPNYSGIFEFSVAKNGGVKYFEANCTYLPMNPYIQINPNWGRLYSKDFNDNRGLICSGEFSLPIVNDAWIQYQLNNKNYEKSFNRQIQSMELSKNMALAQGIKNIGASVITGGTSAIPSVVNSGIDMAMAQTLRQDAINLQKDQFNYSLQNIQALPQTLGRTTSYTVNNKYFPFLEKYSCTDIEREAFRNKIKYDGMTVLTIGTISEYIGNPDTFIKGQMIRIEGDNYYEDKHTSETIRERIAQGIYI